jgi:hypothetical protein
MNSVKNASVWTPQQIQVNQFSFLSLITLLEVISINLCSFDQLELQNIQSNQLFCSPSLSTPNPMFPFAVPFGVN